MSSGALAAFMTVITVLLGLVGALLLIIFNDMRGDMKHNTKHIEGLMHSWGNMLTRMNGVEDHLAEKDGYRPPRIIGDHERS